MHLRDKLINDIRDGIGSTQVDDNSNKSILARGCDPEMGRRAVELIPPILGMPEMVAVTNDDDFIRELQRKKWSVVHFAPGACRYNATKSPIPGSSEHTNGWGFEQYRELVRKYQGEDIKIIEHNLQQNITTEQAIFRDMESRIGKLADDKIYNLRVDLGQARKAREDTEDSMSRLNNEESNNIASNLEQEKHIMESSYEKLLLKVQEEVMKARDLVEMEKKVREETQSTLTRMFEDMTNKICNDVNLERRAREESEAQMLNVIEQTMGKV